MSAYISMGRSTIMRATTYETQPPATSLKIRMLGLCNSALDDSRRQ